MTRQQRSYRIAHTLALPLALLSCSCCDPCQFSILSSLAPASHARPLRCCRCPPRVGRRCRALTPGCRPSVCIVIAAVLRPGHHSCRCCCGTLPSILFAGACACALPTHPRAARVGCRPASAPVRLRTVRRCVGVRHVAAATHMRVCTATVQLLCGTLPGPPCHPAATGLRRCATAVAAARAVGRCRARVATAFAIARIVPLPCGALPARSRRIPHQHVLRCLCVVLRPFLPLE